MSSKRVGGLRLSDKTVARLERMSAQEHQWAREATEAGDEDRAKLHTENAQEYDRLLRVMVKP